MDFQFYDRSSRKINQFLVIAAVSISGYTLGSILGWSAPADKIMQVDGMEVKKLLHAISIVYLGAAISQIYLAATFHIIGRKLHMILASIPVVLCWIMMAICNNFYLYLIGRFFLGFSGSLILVIGPTFIIETVEEHFRVPSLLLFQIMLSLGIFTVFLLGLDKDRMILCIPNSIPPSLVLLLMIYLKDTPSAFMTKGNTIAADKALRFYRGKYFNITKEFEEIEAYVDSLQGETWLGDVHNQNARKGIRKLIVCHTIQQLSGFNLILHYNTDIFELASSRLNSPISTVIFGGFLVIAMLGSVFMVNRGRRLLWCLSTAGMTISTSMLTAYFYILFYDDVAAKKLSYLPLLGMCCFSFAFAIGAGPLPFMMTIEILPPDSKAHVGCLLIAYNCLLAYFIILLVAILREYVQESHIFLGHTVFNFIGFVYSLVLKPVKHSVNNENDRI